MKRLVTNNQPFTCSYTHGAHYSVIDKHGNKVSKNDRKKGVYLRSRASITAFIDIKGYLHLYPGWNKDKQSLMHLCKFVNVSTTVIKNLIAKKSKHIILEDKCITIKHENHANYE